MRACKIASIDVRWLLVAMCLVAALLLGGACQRQPAKKQPSLSSERTSTPPAKQSADGQAKGKPADAVAASEAIGPTELQPAEDQLVVGAVSGRDLYLRHCAACHGEQGDGNGIAAAYLFPKPRNFRAGKFRLISTTNTVSTPEDLHAVLLRGMPGSAMPPWPQLRESELQAVIQEVMRLRREGARDQIVKLLKDEGYSDDEIEDQEVQQFVESRTKAGPVKEVPAIDPPDESRVASGKEIYFKQSCHSCHGDEGRGDGVQKMVDDEGFPTRPRDLTLGIFKGGHDAASLYRRIAIGMPGSPMPSSTQLTPEQIVDLVHFLRSLSDEETRQSVILTRQHLVAKSVKSVAATTDDVDAELWEGIEPVRLRMAPLWWRDTADPGLEVQAVHDGQAIAVRLSWHDETPDRHAAQSQSFEDGVAVELYRGDAEPFVGMGNADAPVDVWYWDADREDPQFAIEDEYPQTVVDVYPFSEQAVSTADYVRPGTKLAAQPEVSLPALASGNQIVPAEGAGGSELAGAGPGTVTFRLPQNQFVSAHGQWKDNRWMVVMTRQLALPDSAGGGITLEPGGTASIAFALWDGSHSDRDGQKLITMWQDLSLENEQP